MTQFFRSGHGRLAVAASLAILAAFTLGSQARTATESAATSALFATAFLPIYWFAAAIAWRASTSSGLDAGGERAWKLIAIANALLAINNLLFVIKRHVAPFPGDDLLIAVVIPGLWYGALFWGLAKLPRKMDSALERLTFWLDAATVFFSGLVILLYVFGHTPGQSSLDSPIAALTTIGFPALNAAAIFAALVVILRPGLGVSRVAIGLLAGALAITVVADLAYNRAAAIGAHRPHVWYEPLYLLAACVTVASAQAQYERRGTGTEWRFELGGIGSSLLPYAAVAAAVFVIVLEIGNRWDTRLGQMVIGAVVLTALVMSRQLIARRHVRLLAEAERARLTRQAALELQLQQAQKLEAVGLLAGGIAHDFNNILMAIRGTAELATPSPESFKTDMREITQAVDHGISLTRQLLAFGRRDAVQLQRFDLRELATSMEPMLRRLVAKQIEVRFTIPPGEVAVEQDRGQIEQVLLNLAINARDAMPAGGTLEIRVGTTVREAPTAVLSAGDYATLLVADTGTGMTPEIQARVFEPFYTTKPRGRGSGLGLSTVYSIVSRAGGGVEVTTAVGKGTTFEVLLPLVPSTDARVAPGQAMDSDLPTTAPATANHVILVVDDEPQLRELLARFLSRRGYSTITASSATDALDRLAERHFDLLLTDVTMPGMNGLALIERARALYPDLRVICMSGYADVDSVAVPEANYIKKPFGMDTLDRLVRSTLDTG